MKTAFKVLFCLSICLLASALHAQDKPDLDTRGVSGQDFVAQNDFLDIRVGPVSSTRWIFRYAQGQSADAVYLEHYGVWTPDWGGIMPSESMNVEQGFRELQPDRLAEAVITYSQNNRSLRIIRRVQFYPGASRQFNITYVLTNTGSQPIRDVRFFQTIDFDIAGSGGDYAWYNASSDSVFMNDDSYYRVGFTGSIRSSHHGVGQWSFMLNGDWDDGQLNDQTRYPASGTADGGVGLQWNLGDLAPGQSWEVTVTFFFGGAAGIQALIPDRTVGRGREVVLDASASNSVGQIVSYEWDLDGDGQFDDATGVQVTYRWDTIGQYIISVRVRDNEGRVDEDSATITVVPDRDLQIASVELQPSENLKDGQTVAVNIRIRNEGIDSVSQAFRVVAFASSGGANERLVASQDVPSLGANATTDIVMPVRLRGGDSRVRIVVDYYNWVNEVSESNNAQVLEFVPVPAPDLVVSSVRIQPDAGLVDGQRAEAVVTVTNNGADTLSDFRVSLLPGVNGSPMPVNANARINGGLASGASIEVAIPFEVRAGSNQTIGAQADDLDEVGESDENNNGIRSSDPTVQQNAEARIPDIAAPDLVVEALSHVPSSDIAYGQSVRLQAVVRNAGGATLRPITVQFLIDDSSVALLNLNGIAEGASQPLSAEWTATTGTHTLHVVADPNFRVPDPNADNNRASLQLPEIIPPDLEVASLTYSPDSFAFRQRVSVAVEVRNAGQGRINAAVPVQFRIDDTPLQTVNLVPPLPPGSSQIVRVDYTAQAGQHRLQVIVDPNRTLGEANLANNVREVTLPDVPAPDVTVSDIELLPTNPQVGQEFVTTVRVRNLGGQMVGGTRLILEQLSADGQVLATATASIASLAAGLDQRINISSSRPMGAARLRVRVPPDEIGDAQPDNNALETDLPTVPPPDFVLAQLSAQVPSDLRFGSSVRFNVQIRNDGGNFRLPIGYPQGIPVRLYINGQSVAQALVGGLDSGVTTEVTINWNVDRPLDNPVVRVVVDPENVVSEGDETNNASEQQFAMRVEPVDFTVAAIDIQPVGKVAGDTANVVVTVRSSGAYVGRLQVAAEVDGNRLAPVEANVNVPEGGTTQVSLRWPVTPGDSRAIRAEVDPSNLVAETDDNNNVLNHVVNYPVDAPDLVFGELQYAPTEGLRQGDTVRLQLQIQNNGGAYAGNVPVRVSIGSGFLRTYSIAVPPPGESRTLLVDWPALQGNNHPLTAVIDPDNVVPESNEDNNSLARLLTLNVAPRPALELAQVTEPPVPIAPGQTVDIDIVLANNGQVELMPVLEVTGLPEGWGDLNALSLRLIPGDQVRQRLRIQVPTNTGSREVTFTVRATAVAYGLEVSAQRTLRIVAEPVITALSPSNNTTVGSTDVTIRWYTHVPASTEVLYRSSADPDWTTVSGEPGTNHAVTLRNLRRNARYLFIARSSNAYGTSQSEERSFVVTKGIVFAQSDIRLEARRDYDQRFSVSVRNNDTRPHQVQVSVLNEYPDAPANFIGPGSFDEPIIIPANGAVSLTFACHFQDAQNTTYTWRFVARTVGESEPMVDECQATVVVRPSQAQLVVDLVGEDPATQVRTYRIRNVGTEPATDVNVAPDDALSGQVGIEPHVTHAYLPPGGSLEFKAFPLYSAQGVGGMQFENIEQAMLQFENTVSSAANLVPFDMYISLNGVEIGALQNQIPLGVQVFEVPPAVFALSNTRSARIPPGTARVLTPEEVARIRAASRAAGNLKVWNGNQPPLRLTLNTDCPPGTQPYEVNLGPKVLARRVQSVHCANQADVRINIGSPPGGVLRIRKSNFNDGHFWNMSNFVMKLCMRDVILTVCARSPEEALQIAEARVQELYKQVPRNLAVRDVTFLEAGLVGFDPIQEPISVPWRGNVRVRIEGDGDLSMATVKVDFDNGDPGVVLQPLGSTGVFVSGVQLRNTPRTVIRVPGEDIQGVIRYTVTVRGCEGTITQTGQIRARTEPLIVRFTQPDMTETGQFKQPIRIPFKGTATVMVEGVVVDAKTQQPVENAIVRLTGTLHKLLPSALSQTVSYNEDWRPVSRNGKFVFVLLVDEPGYLEASVEARHAAVLLAPGQTIEPARKSFTALAVTTVRYHVEADNYRQLEPEGDVEVELRPGLKELNGVVRAWQLEGNTLVLKPLRNARVVIENGGSLRTNADGEYRLQIDRNGSETESIDFKLLPEDIELTVMAVPTGMLARDTFRGGIVAAVGKDLQLEVANGRPRVLSGTLVTNREFDVSVTAGTVGEVVQEAPRMYAYFPPSLTSGSQEVTVTVSDREIPQLKATKRFRVYRDSLLQFHKVGFQDADAPVPTRTVNGVTQLPEYISGTVINRFGGDPSYVAGVRVTWLRGDQELIGYSSLTYQLPEVLPPDTEPTTLPDQPVLYDSAVIDLHKAVSRLDAKFQLGWDPVYGFPDLRLLERLRYIDHQSERYEQELRSLVSAAWRLQEAVPSFEESYDAVKQYGEGALKALVDILLFFASELKLFEAATDAFTAVRGAKINEKLVEGAFDNTIAGLPANIRQLFEANPRLRSNALAELGKGLSEANITRVAEMLKVEAGLDDAFKTQFMEGLLFQRGKIQASLEGLVSAVRGEITGLLRKAAEASRKPDAPVPFDIENQLVSRVVDGVFDGIDGLIQGAVKDNFNLSLTALYDSVVSAAVWPFAETFYGSVREGISTSLRRLDGTIRTTKNLPGDDAAIRERMHYLRDLIQNDRQWFEASGQPFTLVTDWINNTLKSSRDVVLGNTPWWAHVLNFVGSVADGLLPVGKVVQLSTAGVVIRRAAIAQILIWSYLLHGEPEPQQMVDSVSENLFNLLNNWLNGTGGRGVYGARSRQNTQFEVAARRVVALLNAPQVAPEQLQQAVNDLSAAVFTLNEALRSREAVLNVNWLQGAIADNSFASQAGAAVDLVDRSAARRMQLLAAVAGFIESDNPAQAQSYVDLYNRLLEDAIAVSAAAETQVNEAIQRLQVIGGQLPGIFYVSGAVTPQQNGTQDIQVTVRNEGGAATLPAEVDIQVSGAFDLISARVVNIPALAPGQAFTFTATVRAAPARGSTGLAVVTVRETASSNQSEPKPSATGWIPLSSVDTIAPQIIALSPAAGETVRSAQPLVAAQVLDSGGIAPASVRMTIDGGEVQAVYDMQTAILRYQPATSLATGEHRVQVSASDLSGNVGSAEWTFVVNPDAPAEVKELTVAPDPFSPNGDNLDDAVRVRFRLTGEAPVEVVVLNSKGQVVRTLHALAPLSAQAHEFMWDGKDDAQQPLSAGRYVVRVRIPADGTQTEQIAEKTVRLVEGALTITGVSLSQESFKIGREATTLRFNLSQPADVVVRVFRAADTTDEGAVVRQFRLGTKSGAQSITWDGTADNRVYTAKGVHTFQIVADAGTELVKLDAAQVNAIGLPNLMPMQLSAAEEEGRTRLSVVVRNGGEEPAENIAVRLMYGSQNIGDVTVAALSPRQQQTVSLLWDAHRGLLTRDITVVVDPDNTIEEMNEYDNTLLQSVDVAPLRLTNDFPAGLSLISVPMLPLEANPAAVLGIDPTQLRIAWWDPVAGTYRVGNDITALEPGKAYWVRLPASAQRLLAGVRASRMVHLQPGWNLFGITTESPVVWDVQRIQVRANNQVLSLAQAQQAGWIEDYAWGWQQDPADPNRGNYVLIYDASLIPGIGNQLEPWKGYWIKANVECDLILP